MSPLLLPDSRVNKQIQSAERVKQASEQLEAAKVIKPELSLMIRSRLVFPNAYLIPYGWGLYK